MLLSIGLGDLETHPTFDCGYPFDHSSFVLFFCNALLTFLSTSYLFFKSHIFEVFLFLLQMGARSEERTSCPCKGPCIHLLLFPCLSFMAFGRWVDLWKTSQSSVFLNAKWILQTAKTIGIQGKERWDLRWTLNKVCVRNRKKEGGHYGETNGFSWARNVFIVHGHQEDQSD